MPLVKQIHLHLADVPIAGVEYAAEDAGLVVEGKADAAGAALGAQAAHEVERSQLQRLFKALLVQRVEQVDVDMVGAQLLHLLVENPLHVLRVFKSHMGNLVARRTRSR